MAAVLLSWDTTNSRLLTTTVNASDVATKTSPTLTGPVIDTIRAANTWPLLAFFDNVGVAGTANWVIIENNPTGSSPLILVDGTDSTVGLDINTKNGGGVRINTIPVVTTTAAQALTTKTATLAAGTSSVAPLVLTSGTNLTTAAAGAEEYDGKVFYLTTNASNRGVNPAVMMIRQHATNNLNSADTAAHPLFSGSTNGALTLPVGAYRFNLLASISSMSATSGNGLFSLGGNATLANVLFMDIGRDGGLNVVATPDIYMSTAAAETSTGHTAQTATSVQLNITGTFEVTVTGTVIPSYAQTTAAAAVLAAGSYFECWCVGATTMTTVGNWS